jgi:hypothetical protein
LSPKLDQAALFSHLTLIPSVDPKRLPKMRDRGRSKIREGKQCFIRDFVYLADSLQPGREQRVLYLRWKPDFTDWHVIRKLWRWLKLAHLPFAFGRSTRTTTSETQPPAAGKPRRKAEAVVFHNPAALASCFGAAGDQDQITGIGGNMDEAEFTTQAIEVYLSDLMKQGFTKEQAIARAHERITAAQKAVVQERRAGFKIVE